MASVRSTLFSFVAVLLLLPALSSALPFQRSNDNINESDRITISLSVVFGSISAVGVAAAIYFSIQLRNEKNSASSQERKILAQQVIEKDEVIEQLERQKVVQQLDQAEAEVERLKEVVKGYEKRVQNLLERGFWRRVVNKNEKGYRGTVAALTDP